MADGEYPILAVSEVDTLRDEQMGSKRKFWFLSSENHSLWLFKYSREGTGEDWAEKIASELAALLCLPHARVELAMCRQRRGSISQDFTDNKSKGELVHGNELLVDIDTQYPLYERYRVSQHTVSNIARALSQDFVMPLTIDFFPGRRCDAKGVFLGYLLLDALIGNTDRHHENWALLAKSHAGKRVAQLAPTFDHASSLGRELTDERVSACLVDSRDKNALTVEKYAERAKSAIYADNGKKLSPLEAFAAFHSHGGTAGSIWLDKLSRTSDHMMQIVVERVPTSVLGPKRREFVGRFLRHNRSRLLGVGVGS